MRHQVRQLLVTAARTLELAGPAAVIATEASARDAASWLRRHLAGQPVLDCRVQDRRPPGRERIFQGLAIRHSSLRTLVCLDVVERYDETEHLLEQTLPLLAPGGFALITADVALARPHEGLSRVLTPLGLERLVADLDAAIVGWQGDADFPHNLFLVACRSPVSAGFAERAGRFTDEFTSAVTTAARSAAWPARFWRWLSARAGRGRAAAEHNSDPPCFSLHLPAAGDWRQALFTRAGSRDISRARIDAR